MRVVLHGLTHNIGHLIEAAILNALHSMENTTLHGLKAIIQVGHGTLQDNIRGVVQEPILVHAREPAHTILGRGKSIILTTRSISHNLSILRLRSKHILVLNNIFVILH